MLIKNSKDALLSYLKPREIFTLMAQSQKHIDINTYESRKSKNNENNLLTQLYI